MLRCKADEIVVITRTTQHTRQFVGAIVRTLRLVEVGDFGINFASPQNQKYGPIWVVSFERGTRPKYPRHDDRIPATLGVWPDMWMRPIRDDGSQFDETMFWCEPPGVKVHG